MAAALAEEAAEMGFTPILIIDSRLPPPPSLVPREIWQSREVLAAHEERDILQTEPPQHQWTIVIAPETGGWLARRAGWVDACRGARLGPPLESIELASDKHCTAEHLQASDVPTPRGGLITVGEAWPVPAGRPIVLKPRDGAGSTDTYVVDGPEAAQKTLGKISLPLRWEEFHPGQATSVVCLCGPPPTSGEPHRIVSLPACRQDVRLSGDPPALTYHGGSLPFHPTLDARARRLAERAIRTLHAPLGWLGVDLVLGEVEDGSEDVVIEINPRYTTSLVGLRAALDVNLLAATIAIAEGRPTPDLDAALRGSPRPIEFDPDGTIRRR